MLDQSDIRLPDIADAFDTSEASELIDVTELRLMAMSDPELRRNTSDISSV